MTCIYIHYTASVVMANALFWPEYTFKILRQTKVRKLKLQTKQTTQYQSKLVNQLNPSDS